MRFRSLQAIHIQNLSNRCRHKYDRVNFTNFSNLTFCRVFVVWPNCAGGAFTYIPGLRFKLASSSAFLLLLSKSLTEAAIRVWSVLALPHLKSKKKKIPHNHWLRIRVWWVVWNLIRGYKVYHQKMNRLILNDCVLKFKWR